MSEVRGAGWRRKRKGDGGEGEGGMMWNHTSLLADFSLQREECLMLELLFSPQIPSSLYIWYPSKCQR